MAVSEHETEGMQCHESENEGQLSVTGTAEQEWEIDERESDRHPEREWLDGLTEGGPVDRDDRGRHPRTVRAVRSSLLHTYLR